MIEVSEKRFDEQEMEITALRQQLASRDAEVAELRADANEVQAARHVQNEHNDLLVKNHKLRQQLARRDVEISCLKLDAADLTKILVKQAAERDQLRKDVEILLDAVKYSKHQCESIRTWGGMSWVYHPLQAGRIFNKCEEALAATEPTK